MSFVLVSSHDLLNYDLHEAFHGSTVKQRQKQKQGQGNAKQWQGNVTQAKPSKTFKMDHDFVVKEALPQCDWVSHALPHFSCYTQDM